MWHEKHYASRQIFLLWMFTSMILTQYYNSYLISILTVPQFEPPIDTVDDLIHALKRNSYQLFTHNKFAYNKELEQSRYSDEDALMYHIGHKLNE